MAQGAGVSVDSLHVKLGRREVLSGLSLDCEGGLNVIIGPNGSGKTTLLRAIVGLIPHERGRVRVGGIDLGRQPRRARQRIGFLPQRSGFPKNFTTREALIYAAWLQEMRVPAAREKIDELVERLGLEESIDSRIGALSGGTLQRVLFAQALVHSPPIILLDEPTVGLDLAQQSAFRELVRDLAGGSTILMTTHHKEDIEGLADRLILLGEGRVAWSGGLDLLIELAHTDGPLLSSAGNETRELVSALVAPRRRT